MAESSTAPVRTGPSEDLSWLLATAFRVHLGALRGAVGDLPHGARGYAALREAAEPDARNQAELAKVLGLDRTVMVYLVDDLETAGLVERVPDLNDRRSKLIRATPAGVARLCELRRATAAAEAELLSDFSPAETDLLHALLRRITARGSRYDQAHDECQAAENQC
ncbi:MAG TPA: MarR family transcriptional regulator [Actinospica sp.]|jgi:DNA-binding MarR family transcriptional regulator|nr:MarR family transcriptional regulator [Actinospica sp.]